jgi:hypothetical protein
VFPPDDIDYSLSVDSENPLKSFDKELVEGAAIVIVFSRVEFSFGFHSSSEVGVKLFENLWDDQSSFVAVVYKESDVSPSITKSTIHSRVVSEQGFDVSLIE